jgi:hypothetical protein
MNQSNPAVWPSTPIPEDLRPLFAKRPIVFGEPPKLYDTLLSRVASEAKPQDTVQWLYVKDIVDLTWEIQRYRDFQAAIVQKSMVQSLFGYLIPSTSCKADGTLCYHEDLTGRRVRRRKFNYLSLARRYFSGDPAAKLKVDAILAKKRIELDLDSEMTGAITGRLSTLEIINRIAAGAETRRDRALREIGLRQQQFGERIRHAVNAEKEEAYPSQRIGNESKGVPENGPSPLISRSESGS